MTQESIRSALELRGLNNLAAVYHNLPTCLLYEEVVRRREGRVAHLGPLRDVGTHRMVRQYLLHSYALGDET